MTADRTIRIVLCDDHRIVTEGMQQLLSDVTDMECVGTAHTGVEAIYLLDHLAADVLLTDLDIFPVLSFYQVMCFSIIVQHPYFFSEPAHTGIHFNSLVPGYCIICIVMHDHQRSSYFG